MFSGDFLQLPPIERGSLAQTVDRFVQHDGEDGDLLKGAASTVASDTGEASQGMLLWRGLTRVVSLTVNVRAPGVLGRLQSEMRTGQISDDMWGLYVSRVMQPSDPRLHLPPFSTSPVQYIVHRHRVRVSQSFQNAVEHCRRHELRLYVCKASVEAKGGEEHFLTPGVLAELLHLTSQRQTQNVESSLPLYLGMRLL